MGQQFVLEAGTLFLVEDGGQFGPVPYVPSQSLDFNRSKIVVGAGGVFASGLGVTESSVYQAEVEVLLGGVIQDGLNMGGGSSLLIDGGEVGQGLSFAGTEILMRSGSIGGGLYAATNARFIMEDGMIGGSVSATSNAQFNVCAGDILSNFRLSGSATLTLRAGRIVENLLATDSASVLWNGGVVAGSVQVDSVAVATILGADFRLDGKSVSGAPDSLQGDQVLTGVLEDGTPFILSAAAGDSVRSGGLVLVPVPMDPVGPDPIIVDSGLGPQGARAGQRVVLSGGELPWGFVGVGADIEVMSGVIGSRFEVAGSRVEMWNGSVGDLGRVLGESVVNIHGGSVGGWWLVAAGGRMNISGGQVSYHLNVSSNGDVHLFSGSIGNNTVVLSGGTLRVSGGDFGPGLKILAGGFLHLAVVAATLDGVPLDLDVGHSVVINQRGGSVLRVRWENGLDRDIILTEQFNFEHEFFQPGSTLTLTRVASCPADLADPFEELDKFDVSAFIDLYRAEDPAADFVFPFGVWNFFDISAFLAAYNAGCP